MGKVILRCTKCGIVANISGDIVRADELKLGHEIGLFEYKCQNCNAVILSQENNGKIENGFRIHTHLHCTKCNKSFLLKELKIVTNNSRTEGSDKLVDGAHKCPECGEVVFDWIGMYANGEQDE
jgi:phage FluMu protein Com